MSLTSILKKEKGRSFLKSWFKHHFPNPGVSIQKEILVSSDLSSSDAGEMGTAFDYLFRFNLERINSINYKSKQWVAALGLKRLIRLMNGSKAINVTIGYERKVNKKALIKVVIDSFAKAQQNYKKFIENGLLNVDLIKSCVFLAKLDVVVRAGIISADFEQIETEKIVELENLFNNVPWHDFKSHERCLLNPTFGSGSELVGGADCDLIIDDFLIDLKSNKYLKVEREDLNQIIGYYLLSVIGECHAGVKEIGIYFARFGFLWSVPLESFHNMHDYPILAEEFVRLVNDNELDLTKDSLLKPLQRNIRSVKKRNKELPDEYEW